MAVIRLSTEVTFPLSACGFDLDGVLRDTGYLAYESVCRTAVELGGKAPTFEDFVHDWGGLLFVYFREHCEVTASDADIRAVNDKYLQAHDLVGPYSDVVSTVAHLNALGVELFVLSGHAHAKVKAWFVEHALHAHFVEVRGDGRDKVAQLTELREQFSKGKLVCYVGDWAQDMRSAQAAGVVPIGITRGQKTGPVLSKSGAAVVVDHLHDLTRLIV